VNPKGTDLPIFLMWYLAVGAFFAVAFLKILTTDGFEEMGEDKDSSFARELIVMALRNQPNFSIIFLGLITVFWLPLFCMSVFDKASS